MDESNRMRALAATAAAKAQQRKMTDFLGQAKQQELPSGAGELLSGPCGSAASLPGSRSLVDDADRIQQQIRKLRERQEQSEQSDAQKLIQKFREQDKILAEEKAAALTASNATPSRAAATAATATGAEEAEEDDGGWRVWTNRKNRRVGQDLEQERRVERQVREKTPFRLPGQPLMEHRGYYTSAAKRNQALADQGRSNQASPAAALSDQQWFWFKKRLCLSCGMDHQVKDCPDLARRDEGHALLKAALSCPVDMRPQGRRAPPGAKRRTGPSGAARVPSSTVTSATATKTSSHQAEATKRSRDTGAGSGSGLTPEAKRAKQFSEAAKAGLTLFVREKDGSALTEERYLSLKSSFAYFVEDMMSRNKDPPICSGRWTHSRAVVRIPMEGETDLLWMRCFLDKSYLVQTEEEFNRSKGNIYVAYLRDRLEPEMTGMRADKLASFVRFYKRQMKIDSLFDLKMAAKTPKGKAIHLVMDDKAEEIFVSDGCRIPLAGAGWVTFEDRNSYVARIKAQERKKHKPKPSTLEKGLLAQEVDVSKMSVDDDEVVEIGRSSGAGPQEENPPKGTKKAEEQELHNRLVEEVRQGRLNLETAKAKFMELTGETLEMPKPRRTVSGTSWSEEVEMARNLEIPEPLSEEKEAPADDNDDNDDDQARFELRHENDAQVGHRAAGSAGPGAGAACS